MSEYLFAYGTLQAGLAPAYLSLVTCRLAQAGAGSMRGRLYDLGEYPGAVLDETSDSRVFGTVFRLPDDVRILEALDRYEDYDPESPETSLFVRVMQSVELMDGGSVACWVYLYNRKIGNARILTSGKFEKK